MRVGGTLPVAELFNRPGARRRVLDVPAAADWLQHRCGGIHAIRMLSRKFIVSRKDFVEVANPNTDFSALRTDTNKRELNRLPFL